ncbi:hypothetical protein, partial [Providencia rustigianii]
CVVTSSRDLLAWQEHSCLINLKVHSMKKLLAITTILSLAVSGAALANTTVKTEHVNHGAKTHEVAKAEHGKKEIKKSEVKKTSELIAPVAAKASK